MTAALWAERALIAHDAMRRQFGRSGGLYGRDGRLHLPGAVAHLWPFERALVATLDVAGVPAGLRAGFDVDHAVTRDLGALERYWRPERRPPGYSSDARHTRFGGDVYYDDNAWAGLALIQLERLRPGGGWLGRAGELFSLAVSGWDHRTDAPSPGGVFWVTQGTGLGVRNHDRNTVSSAPNAELGLHLEELTGATPRGSGPGAREMIAWVEGSLHDGAGLYWDKIRGDGTIDRARWSYNQGSMVGAQVLLARLGDDPGRRLTRAATIARAALDHYAGGYELQPPAFNAIFFRNLLLLHHASDDSELRSRILDAIGDYADRAWAQWRDRRGRFARPGQPPTLLDQSAIVSTSALLAWAPEDYVKLA
ncbi:MAG: glycoside hydrolase family 76 protein [Solirubrobacteraceae bacterium]